MLCCFHNPKSKISEASDEVYLRDFHLFLPVFRSSYYRTPFMKANRFVIPTNGDFLVYSFQLRRKISAIVSTYANPPNNNFTPAGNMHHQGLANVLHKITIFRQFHRSCECVNARELVLWRFDNRLLFRNTPKQESTKHYRETPPEGKINPCSFV